METFAFAESQKRSRPQVVMNGNEALAYGLIAAGVRFGAGYPITPWSDIMEVLRRELPKYGGVFIQCEDEIASISMALGASYGGRVAVLWEPMPELKITPRVIWQKIDTDGFNREVNSRIIATRIDEELAIATGMPCVTARIADP